MSRLLMLMALLAPLHLAGAYVWAQEYGDYGDYGGDFDGSYDDSLLEGVDVPEDGPEGPGTRWRKCREQSWADYNTCLMQDPYDSTNQKVCFVAWDLDRFGCDVALVQEVFFPFLTLKK